jgi:ribonuclease HII
MRRAIDGLEIKADFALIDGNIARDFQIPARAVIGGDAISPSIAAASILAKVTRDRQCEELDRLYPQYGIAKHKGYGTAVHIAALKEFGPTPIHRTRFIRFLNDGTEDDGAADPQAIALAHLPDACAFYTKDGGVASYILDYKHTGEF